MTYLWLSCKWNETEENECTMTIGIERMRGTTMEVDKDIDEEELVKGHFCFCSNVGMRSLNLT